MSFIVALFLDKISECQKYLKNEKQVTKHAFTNMLTPTSEVLSALRPLQRRIISQNYKDFISLQDNGLDF